MANDTAIEDSIKAEINKFEGLKLASAGESKYTKGGIFDLQSFFNDCASLAITALPLHAPSTAPPPPRVQTSTCSRCTRRSSAATWAP